MSKNVTQLFDTQKSLLWLSHSNSENNIDEEIPLISVLTHLFWIWPHPEWDSRWRTGEVSEIVICRSKIKLGFPKTKKNRECQIKVI